MNALSTLTIDELKQGREDTFSDEMLRAIDAELARREQAQAADNNALMTEAAQKIDRLAAENARLRSLLAALTEAASRHVICMNFNLPYRGLAQEEWATREKLRAAIAKAKGGAL